MNANYRNISYFNEFGFMIPMIIWHVWKEICVCCRSTIWWTYNKIMLSDIYIYSFSFLLYVFSPISQLHCICPEFELFYTFKQPKQYHRNIFIRIMNSKSSSTQHFFPKIPEANNTLNHFTLYTNSSKKKKKCSSATFIHFIQPISEHGWNGIY